MIQFETTDNLFYSLPEKIVRSHRGYFNLISSGKIPMHSHQIDYIFFGVDEFQPDEFVQSIPVFLQISNESLNEKMIDKIHGMIQENDKKIDFSKPKVREYVFPLIESYISETTTFEKLRQFVLSKIKINWAIGTNSIVYHLKSLKTNSEIKDYIMTLNELNQDIIHYLYDLPYYFEKDDFNIYFIQHHSYLKQNICHHRLLECIFTWGSPFMFRYIIENVSWINTENLLKNRIGGSYLIHYASRRNLEDIVIYLIEKGADINVHDHQKLSINYICHYSSPRLLKYMLQFKSLIYCNKYGLFGNVKYELEYNRNPEMVQFLIDIKYKHGIHDLDYVVKYLETHEQMKRI